jgi:hypothetical protein
VQVGDSLDDLGDKELIQSALREDVEAIRHYGEANPESWTGLHFENEPRVLIVASFVGDLERHELELRRSRSSMTWQARYIALSVNAKP